MGLCSTEAIVVGGHNLGEADRIIVFYTRNRGKVRAVAAGARRMRSRFGGSLEIFTRGGLVYFERPQTTLHKVNEFAALESFRELREDLLWLGQGAYLIELASAAVPDEEPNEDLYSLLSHSLHLLTQVPSPDLLLRAFEIHLLRILGYLPELHHCLLCKAPTPPAAGLGLSPHHGGLICPSCQPQARDSLPLSPPSLAFLLSVLRSDICLTLKIPEDSSIKGELNSCLGSCIAYFLGKTIRSKDFLTQLSVPL